MDTSLLRPSIVMLISTMGITLAQLLRVKGLMLLEERLNLAIRTTRTFSFFFLIMSLILVITSPNVGWLEAVLWAVCIFGILLHSLMVFKKPEMWQSIATIFFLSTMIFTAIIALLGTFQ